MDERERHALDLERRHRGKKTRPVRLIENGQEFVSASALADFLGVSPAGVKLMLQDGRAEYAGDPQ